MERCLREITKVWGVVPLVLHLVINLWTGRTRLQKKTSIVPKIKPSVMNTKLKILYQRWKPGPNCILGWFRTLKTHWFRVYFWKIETCSVTERLIILSTFLWVTVGDNILHMQLWQQLWSYNIASGFPRIKQHSEWCSGGRSSSYHSGGSSNTDRSDSCTENPSESFHPHPPQKIMSGCLSQAAYNCLLFNCSLQSFWNRPPCVLSHLSVPVTKQVFLHLQFDAQDTLRQSASPLAMGIFLTH